MAAFPMRSSSTMTASTKPPKTATRSPVPACSGRAPSGRVEELYEGSSSGPTKTTTASMGSTNRARRVARCSSTFAFGRGLRFSQNSIEQLYQAICQNGSLSTTSIMKSYFTQKSSLNPCISLAPKSLVVCKRRETVALSLKNSVHLFLAFFLNFVTYEKT